MTTALKILFLFIVLWFASVGAATLGYVAGALSEGRTTIEIW